MTAPIARSRRSRSIMLRVSAVVMLATIFALVLASAVAVFAVQDDKLATITESGIGEANRARDGLDVRLERARSDLAAVALAAIDGRFTLASELVAPDMSAVRIVMRDEELFEAARDRETRDRLHAMETDPDAVTILSRTELGIERRVDGVRAIAIIDVSRVLAELPEGWTAELDPSSVVDPNAGVVARLITDSSGAEYIDVSVASEAGILRLRAPAEPARRSASVVVRHILLWSWTAVIPIFLLGLILSRAVTAPVRRLADAVAQSDPETLELPSLPPDEIGDLGLAIQDMTGRIHSHQEALRAAIRFARHAGRATSDEAIIEELQSVLRDAVPDTEWFAVSAGDIEAGLFDEVALGVTAIGLKRTLKDPDGSDPPPVGRRRMQTVKIPDVAAVDDVILVPLRFEDRAYGVIVGRGAKGDQATVRTAQLFCRVAIAALRNLELSHRALANEKMSALGRLAGSVAHEVNNPLSSVLAHLHTLRRDVDGDVLVRVGEAIKSAERVSAIVRDLSALARGGRAVSMLEADLPSLARQAIAAVRKRGPHVEVQLDAPEQLGVHCSPSRVEQALTNIIGNAIEAVSSRADPWVEVRVRRDGDRAQVTVRDNGLGIPTRIRKRLFEPFVTGKGDEGTGLGLYLSRAFARTHGGALNLKTTGANGTTFELWLPLRPAVPSAQPEPVDTGLHSTKKSRILLVDDDKSVLNAHQRWLGRFAKVEATSDPRRALERALAEDFDLVIVDVHMQPIGGVEFVAALVSKRPEMKSRAVFLTGAQTDAVPGYVVIGKPLRPKDVDRLLAIASEGSGDKVERVQECVA